MSHFCKNKVDYDNAVSMLRVYFTLNCAGKFRAALLVQIYSARGLFVKLTEIQKSPRKFETITSGAFVRRRQTLPQ